MKQAVMIKSNQYGMTIILDKNISFNSLLSAVAKKFQESAKFFKDAKMAVTFEGRRLSAVEEEKLVETIQDNSSMEIICIIDTDKEREEFFRRVIEEEMKPKPSADGGQFYKGTLRSGQVLESDGSMIVLGDVNPGARIMAAGNIIILGNLKGSAFAGAAGNSSAFVVALEMNAMQIRIADCIARSGDDRKNFSDSPMIAYIEEGNIYVEPLCKEVLNDMNFL